MVHGKRFGKLEAAGDRVIFDLEAWAAREADLVLVNSRAIGREAEEVYGCDPAKIRLLHCAIDPDRFVSRQPSSRISAFRSVLAGRDEILVTYAGRLDLEKGIDTLVNAFATLHGELPRTRLAIVGKGTLEDTIQEHVKKLGLEGAVALHGYLKGEVLKHVYIASDVHVCPSHYEPFGLVAAEAMAAGTPVVVSATGGLTDVVISPSVGRTFPPRDSGALAKALLELARDRRLRERLGRAGQRHVRDRFSWPRIAKRAVSLYRTAVTQAKRASA